MARKPTPVIIEPSEFRVYLASMMIAQNMTVAQIAERIGLSPANTYKILSGDLAPGAEVLKRVGLRIVYVRDESQIEEVKAKVKK